MCSIFTQYHTIFTLFEVVQIGITAPIQNNESLIMSCGSFKAHSAMPGRDGRKGNPPSSTVRSNEKRRRETLQFKPIVQH